MTRVAAGGLVLALLLLPTVAFSLGQVGANPIGGFYPWSPPPYPVFAVDSPVNGTAYADSTVPLVFNVSTAYTWTGYYVLDNDKNHEYLPNCQPVQVWLDGVKIGEFTWNLTASFSVQLTGLAAGQHTIELNGSVNGEYMKSIDQVATIINYVANGTSRLINFTTMAASATGTPTIAVNTPTPVPSEPSPVQTPTAEPPSPTPTPTAQPSSLTPTSSPTPTPSVPEAPAWAIVPVLLAATTLLAVLGGRKLRRLGP